MRRRTTCLVLGVTNSSWLSILEKESTKPLELLNSLTNDELGLTDGENGVVNAGRSLDEHAEEIIVNQTTGVSQDYRDISFVPEQQHTPLSALGLYNSGHCIDAEDETSEDPAPTERSESPAFTFVNLTTANYAPMLELESFWDSDSDSLHSESGSFDEDGFADAFEAEAANAEVHRLPGEDTSSMQTLGQGTTTFSDGDIAALGEPDEDSVISLDGEGRHSRETSATSNDDGFLVLASPTLEEAPAQQNAASLEDLHDYEVFDHVVDEDSAADSNESVIPDVGSAMNDSTYPHEPQITATFIDMGDDQIKIRITHDHVAPLRWRTALGLSFAENASTCLFPVTTGLADPLQWSEDIDLHFEVDHRAGRIYALHATALTSWGRDVVVELEFAGTSKTGRGDVLFLVLSP